MMINLDGATEISHKLMIGHTVTMVVTFDVESLRDEHVGGTVRSSQITKKYGTGGLDPVVETAREKLQILRTMGTNA